MFIGFIYRLAPFLRMEDHTENRLTSYWVIGLIIIFVAALVYLVIHSERIKKSINIEELPKSEKLKNLWSAYKDTFREFGPVKKTTEFAETYFHEQNILFASFDLRTINNIPNILVGLGILGTFAGLTYGISDFSFETTEEIKSSIDNLLTGMGTAFVTSIWGMFLSLLYGFIFKLWQSKTSDRIKTLCFKLDEEYKIKTYELELHKQNEQRKLINELFDEYLVTETEEGKQMPNNVFRQLLTESVNQTASLRTLSDDLSESIDLAMQKLIDDNNEQLSSLIENKLVPVLEDLKQIKQDSGAAVIEDAVNRLSDSMKSMMDEFKDTLAGDTQKEMEGLTKRLVVVSESLNDIPKSMTNITKQVTEVVDALKKTVLDNITQSQTQAQEISKQNQQMFTTATTEYKSTVEEIQTYMEMLLSTQRNNIDQVFDLTEKIQTTLSDNAEVNQQFEAMLKNAGVVARLIDDVSNKFNTNSNALTETSNNLKDSITHFGESIYTYIDRNDKLLDLHKATMQETKETATEYSEKFEVIQAGLKDVFNQIQTGLKDYQETTKDSLNDYLSGFTTTLANANQSLGSAVSGLDEIMDELSEQIEKLVDNR